MGLWSRLVLTIESNLYVINALLFMYAKCELNAKCGQVKEAAELFRLMLRKGIHVDFVSLYSILGVCAKRGKGCFFINQKNVTGCLVYVCKNWGHG